MPTVNPQTYHMSASSIASFKACPTRFRLAYREGLRLAEDTESQRMGTNWHAMHEEFARVLNALKHNTSDNHEKEQAALTVVVNLLNERYERMPASKTAFEWALERQVLLTSFMGYLWYWQNDPVEVLASEVPFELPIHMPRTGLPLPTSEVLRVGKIDHVIRWQGAVCALERKSTSRAIGPDSDYWDKAKKDTQVSMYALAFRDLKLYSHNSPHVWTLKVWADSTDDFNSIPWFDEGERVGNTLYDVWHKPTIKPTTLTQKATTEFLASKTYCGQEFTVEAFPYGVNESGEMVNPPRCIVNGTETEVEVGKKSFAIKETIDMFGARLLQDITERPDFYFQRREIARTDLELAQFRQQLFAVYTAQKAYAKSGCWFENESQCRATFPCPYIPICYGPGADAVCDGKTTPPGFKRIFVDLTVNGETVDE